ncbi:hypothetical protein D3C78_1541900 [compost metagenome]
MLGVAPGCHMGQARLELVGQLGLVGHDGVGNGLAFRVFGECVHEQAAGIGDFRQPVAQALQRVEHMRHALGRATCKPLEVGAVPIFQRTDNHRFTAGEVLVQRSQRDVGFGTQRLDALFGEAQRGKAAFQVAGDLLFCVGHGAQIQCARSRLERRCG